MSFLISGIVTFLALSFVFIWLSIRASNRAYTRNRYGYPAMKIKGKLNRIIQHNKKSNPEGEMRYYDGKR